MFPILLCQPVELTDEEKKRTGLSSGVPIYANSTRVTCERCQCEVFIGPRQRKLMDNAAIFCWRCCIELKKFDDVDEIQTYIHDLGNPDVESN